MQNFINNIFSRKFLLVLVTIALITFVFMIKDKFSAEVYTGAIVSIVIAYITGNVRSKKYETNVEKINPKRGPPAK